MSELVMNLSSPVEKTPDADLLHDTIGFAGARLMDMEVGAAAGASGAAALRPRWPIPLSVSAKPASGHNAVLDADCVSSRMRLRIVYARRVAGTSRVDAAPR